MKTLGFLFICLFLTANISASPEENNQTYGGIKGMVLDKATGEGLDGVNITIESTRRGTTTNHNGEFEISKIQPGTYTLVFEYIGYAKVKHENISIIVDQTVDLKVIEMVEEPIPLKAIVVTPGSYSIMGSEPSIRQTITSDDIKMMGWAEDITRAIQRVPGISGNDFTAKFNVRGGDVDEVLVLLDGMQIYKPFHQKDFGGGLFSTIDIETLDGLDLLTGGFPADYGDRMSGVLDMTTQKAQEGEHQTSLGLSLMNMRAFSMGAFTGSNGSWLFSARRGYLDIINSLTGNQFKLHPNYYDILGKVDYRIHPKHTLSVHFFLANDTYKLDERIVELGKTSPNIDFLETEYGNNYGWLTLNSFLSTKLYARTILYGGWLPQKRSRLLFDDDPDAHLSSSTVTDDRDFKLAGIKQEWNYEASESIFIKFGMDLKRLSTKFTYSKDIMNEFITANDSLTQQIDTSDVQRTVNGNQLGFFLSSRFQILSPLTLETGLRYDRTSYTGDELVSPRVGLVYALTKSTFLRAGWGYYHQTQNIDDLRIEFGINDYHSAALSKHYVAGLEHHFNNGIQVRAEGYLKRVSNVPDTYITFRNIDEFFPETRDDLIKLVIDESTSKGIEVYAKYDTGNKFSWWLSYVLSQATDNVLAIDYGGPLGLRTGNVPRPWDQRHTINLDVNYRPNRRWHFNLAWQYRTGWPYTPFEVRRIPRGDGTFAHYRENGLYNSLIYPAYHRLDIRINRHFYTSRGKVTVFLHVINAYNHENVNNYDYSILKDTPESFRFEIDTETWFPILPFVGVSWEF